MLKITQIENLFQTHLKLTTCVVPKEILHPQIESDIITQYGDDIKSAWIIIVLDSKLNTFVPYTCVMSTKGNMYRIEYIEIKTPVDANMPSEIQAYTNGYKKGNAKEKIADNPFNPVKTPKHWKLWVDGYHAGYKDSKESISY